MNSRNPSRLCLPDLPRRFQAASGAEAADQTVCGDCWSSSRKEPKLFSESEQPKCQMDWRSQAIQNKYILNLVYCYMSKFYYLMRSGRYQDLEGVPLEHFPSTSAVDSRDLLGHNKY